MGQLEKLRLQALRASGQTSASMGSAQGLQRIKASKPDTVASLKLLKLRTLASSGGKG